MKYLYFIVFLAIFYSCTERGIIFIDETPIDGNIWKADDIKEFEIDVEDTTKTYNFFINFKHTTKYPYRNVIFFTRIESEEAGLKVIDTFPTNLQSNDGKWLGKSAAGGIIDNSIWVIYNNPFPKKGKYKFSIQHAMRKEDLPEIVSIGLKIKEFENER